MAALVLPVKGHLVNDEGQSEYRVAGALAPTTSALSQVVLYSHKGSDLQQLKAHMLLWERRPVPMYSFHSFPDVVEGPRLLRDLVHRSEGVAPETDDEHRALQVYADAGLVQRIHGSWELTMKGRRAVCPEWVLHCPAPVAEIRPNIALQNRTTWELLCLLDEDGWATAPLPRSKKKTGSFIRVHSWAGQVVVQALHHLCGDPNIDSLLVVLAAGRGACHCLRVF